MSTALLNTNEPTASPAVNFFPVPRDLLRCLEQAEFDLFIPGPSHTRMIPLGGAGGAAAPEVIDDRARRPADFVYVRASDADAVLKFLRAELDSLIGDEQIAPEDRLSVVQMALAAELEGCFWLADCDRFVSAALRTGRLIAGLVGGSPISPGKLVRLLQHDGQMSTHLTNVAVYSAVLAKGSAVASEAELERIAVAGLLHDIGKRFISQEILEKTTPLSRQERAMIEEHPRQGYIDLLPFDSLVEAQWLVAYQHHERIDGKGYPVRILGEEIHPWARLTSVTDVFDGLTRRRPHRAASPLPVVLDQLRRAAGTQLDEEMVQCWIRLLIA